MKNIKVLGITLITLSACANTEQVSTDAVVKAEFSLRTDADFIDDGWSKVDKAGFEAIVLGNSIISEGYHKKRGTAAEAIVFYADNGKLTGWAKGDTWGPETDTGSYTISDNGLYCNSWSRWNKSTERCFFWYEKDGLIDAAIQSGESTSGYFWRSTRVSEGNII